MDNPFDQFDAGPAATAPAANPFDHFDEGRNQFDAFDQPAAAVIEPAAPVFTPPELSAYHEPGVIAQSLTKLRESLSPLIGETKTQQMQRHVQQAQLDRDLPIVAKYARESVPMGDVLSERGFAPALVDSLFTPAPGTPQIAIKKTEPNAGTAEQVTVGVRNVGAGVINSLPSPGGLAVLLGGAPARLVTAVLTPILAKHTIENAGPTIGILTDPNASMREKTEAAGNEALSALGAAMGGFGLFKGKPAIAVEPQAPVDSARNEPVKSARDSAAVFEGTAPEPSPSGPPSTAKEAAGVFLEKGPLAREIAADAQREVDAAEYLDKGDKLPQMTPQAQRMYDQYGGMDKGTFLALGRTAAGAALGYATGNTPEEKARNATLGALAALGAPKVLRLLRGQFEDPATVAASPARPIRSSVPPAEPLPIGEAPGTGTLKTRGFVESVKDSPDVSPQVKDLVSGIYETKTRAGVQAFATNLIDAMVQKDPTTGLAQAKAAFLSSADSPTAESWAVGLELARRYDVAKDYAQSADVLEHIAKQATTPARALNFLATLDKMSPQGIGLYVAKVAKNAGVELGEVMTPAVKGRIQTLQQAVGEATTPETKLARQAELFEYINELVPASTGQKLARGLPLALIFHTKVFVKKALGDTTQMVLRTTADNIVPAFDKAFSMVTGSGRTRTWVSIGDQFKGAKQPVVDFMAGFNEARGRGADVFPSIQAGAKTMATLARLATKSAFLDSKATDIRGALRHTYGSWVGRAAEDVVGVGMGIPTRAAYMRAFQSRLAMEMKTAAANGAELTQPTEDMVDRSHLAGMEATFSHENLFSKTLSGVRKAFNGFQPIGIGSSISPLTKVPGGMVDIAVRYTPIGFVRAAYKGGLARIFGKAEAIDRGEALDAFTQAALGTTGLLGTGYWLAKNGVIRSAPEENADAEAVRQASGFGKYSVNLSALKRKMITGQWDVKDGGQIGDLIMPYNWSQPIGLALAMGGELYHQQEINRRAVTKSGPLKQLSSLSQALLGAGRSLEDMELFTGMSRFAKDVSAYGLAKALPMQVLNLPAMFIPSLFRDIRNLQDNTVRELTVSDRAQTATNRFLERIPGIANEMGYPPSRNRFGDVVLRYDTESHGWVNVLANPAYATRIKADPVGAEVLRLWRETGDTNVLPKAIPLTAEIRDVTGAKRSIELTPQQISDLQHWEGNLTRAFYLQLMHSERYVFATDEQRAKKLAEVQNAVHAAGKVVLLGDFPQTERPNGSRVMRAPSALERAIIGAAMESRALGSLTKSGMASRSAAAAAARQPSR